MYKIVETDHFKDDKKYYKKKLTKKGFSELEDSIEALYDDFEQEKFEGVNFFSDEDNNGKAYKLRIGIKAMKLGKSNGMRTIYFAVKDEKEVYMIMLYRKADLDPTTNQLKDAVSTILEQYI